MSQRAQRTGFWQSVKDLPGRTPLRVKLITTLLGLVAIALAVISIAGISVIRTYLLNQADTQLHGLVASLSAPPGFSINTSRSLSPEPWQAEALYGTRLIGFRGYLPAGTPGPQVSPGATWLSKDVRTPVTVPATSGVGRWRVVAYPDQTFSYRNGQSFTGTLIVGLDVTNEYNAIGRLTSIDLVVSGAILLGLVLVGTAVVRASLRPLVEIEKTAGAIAAGDLSRRVPERDPRTEVGRLGRSLNVMLSQIEAAFQSRSQSEAAARRSEERMRQFVADASHELRTPLTAIRGFAEYYRQRGGIESGPTAKAADVRGESGGSPAEVGAAVDNATASEITGLPASSNGTGQLASADLDRIMRRVEQESSRMGVLVEDMLLLARMDQQRPLEQRPVDLLTLAADAVHDARVVAPSRSINLTVGVGAALLVIGDEVRLRQVIGNLMSNALAHTPDGTPIDVLIRSGNLAEAPTATGDDTAVPADQPKQPKPRPAAVLEVADHGPGLTSEQAEHVFERFYRADQARTSGGTGLGLAIVAALVTAHGGTAWVRAQSGEGATFCIALPLAPEAAQGANDDEDAGAELDCSGGADRSASYTSSSRPD